MGRFVWLCAMRATRNPGSATTGPKRSPVAACCWSIASRSDGASTSTGPASACGSRSASTPHLRTKARHLLDRKQLGKTRDLEHALHALGRVAQHEPVALRLDALLRLHEQAQTGRVDELEVGEVDNERVATLLREFDQRPAQGRGGTELQVASDSHDRAGATVLDGDRDHGLERGIVGCHNGSVPNRSPDGTERTLGMFTA